jgi:hypothetical protein
MELLQRELSPPDKGSARHCCGKLSHNAEHDSQTYRLAFITWTFDLPRMTEICDQIVVEAVQENERNETWRRRGNSLLSENASATSKTEGMMLPSISRLSGGGTQSSKSKSIVQKRLPSSLNSLLPSSKLPYSNSSHKRGRKPPVRLRNEHYFQ